MGNIFSQSIAEVKISYSHKVKPSEQKRINSSTEVYKLLAPIWADIDYVETFAVVLLSRANKIIGIKVVSVGGVAGTEVDPKVVFQAALKASASSLILIHNHPSGELRASEQDISITKKIKAGGKVLDIAVLDHIILTSERYLSFADEGIL